MASDIQIQLRGFDELAKQLRELPEKIARHELDRSLREAATPMLRAARANAPVLAHSTTARRSGTLRRSIVMKILRVRGSLNRGITIGVRKLKRRQVRANRLAARISGRRLGVTVSAQWNDPFYWYFLEHGWRVTGRRRGRGMSRASFRKSRQAAGARLIHKPFLRPAFEAHKDQFLTRLRLILGGRIETIWNRKV
jgi:HK97 gp10 family phage protein